MRRTAAQLFKLRLTAPKLDRPRRSKNSPLTLVERALLKQKKKLRDSRWRGWKVRYPELERANHKLCLQCNRILNRDQFKGRGGICSWCKSTNKSRASI